MPRWSLTVQAAHLLAKFVGTPAALDRAREALGAMLQRAPQHPALLETLTELADTTGVLDATLLHSAECALRLVYRQGDPDAALAFERDLVARSPNDLELLWRLEARLADAGDDLARAAYARDDRARGHRSRASQDRTTDGGETLRARDPRRGGAVRVSGGARARARERVRA